MKRIVVLIIAAVLIVGSLVAIGQRWSNKDEEKVRQRVLEWDGAATRRDIPALTSILADDFTMTNANGTVDKKQYLLLIFKAPSKTRDTPSTDLKVQIDGDKATVTGRGTAKVQYRNPHINNEYQFTDVWVKRDGNWQALSTHISQIAQQ